MRSAMSRSLPWSRMISRTSRSHTSAGTHVRGSRSVSALDMLLLLLGEARRANLERVERRSWKCEAGPENPAAQPFDVVFRHRGSEVRVVVCRGGEVPADADLSWHVTRKPHVRAP